MTTSLESAIRTCKVDTGLAASTESARFLDPKLVVCPIWTGYDLVGRQIPYDSFMSKTAGCDTPYSRVIVENSVSRPQYAEFISTSALGVTGNIYGENKMLHDSVSTGNETEKVINLTTGNFNLQWRANIIQGCSPYTYESAQVQMANDAEIARQMQNAQLSAQYGAIGVKVNGN